MLEESRSATRFAALQRGDRSQFVGRGDELKELLDFWQEARRGEGRIAFITGEPGIGKSRLTLELQKQIQSELHSEQFFQCSPFYTDSPLYPFIDELERAADLHHASDSGEKLDRLAALLSRYASDEEDITPLFAKLLSIPTEERIRASPSVRCSGGARRLPRCSIVSRALPSTFPRWSCSRTINGPTPARWSCST